jgi:hypothetical protein
MTRQEQTNTRSLVFSGWIRNKLPASNTGFCVTNQDWVLWNWKERKLMFLEEKTCNGKLATWFNKLIHDVLHPAISKYSKENEIDYRGYHLIQFENEGPEDGKILLDYREVSEQELIDFLSMK